MDLQFHLLMGIVELGRDWARIEYSRLGKIPSRSAIRSRGIVGLFDHRRVKSLGGKNLPYNIDDFARRYASICTE
ncbi:unnamed protein product [Mycena citricolor]|uniref:Uncharacterized protein n=1 Tax=Mycena citricolor TaxID=2018698 RepID=A0AAD2HYU9_9AGAR|nr:unnamed protein product [Mycena citricolor]